METKAQKINRVLKIIKVLEELYPGAKTALLHSSPFELLISTILSAQCTDKSVNKVTGPLFGRFKTPEDFASAKPSEVEKIIHSIGLYRMKTRNIIKCCKKIVLDYGGKVPDNMDKLLTLDGVGRKTANCVLGSGFGIPAVVVDTHVIRLSNLLGFSRNTEPPKIEKDLEEIIPEKDWVFFSDGLIFHGRAVCIARRPKCEICKIIKLCPYRRRKL